MSGCEHIKYDIQLWMRRPISWRDERTRLLIVSAIVIAILAFGAACYTLQGGRYADIPGYNQYYAYAMWTIGSGIALGTIAAYIARSILSRKST